MKEDTFVFYPSFYYQLSKIKSESVRLSLYEAIARYGTTGETTDFGNNDPMGLMEAIFQNCKKCIDDAKANRERVSQVRKGARAKALLSSQTKGITGEDNIQEPNGISFNKEVLPTNVDKTQQNNQVLTNDDYPQQNNNLSANVAVYVNDNGNVYDNNNSSIIEEKCSLLPKEEINHSQMPKSGQCFKKPSVSEIEAYILDNSISGVDANQFYDFYESNGWLVGKAKMKNWQATLRNWSRRSEQSTASPCNFRPSINSRSTGSIEPEYGLHIPREDNNHNSPPRKQYGKWGPIEPEYGLIIPDDAQ